MHCTSHGPRSLIGSSLESLHFLRLEGSSDSDTIWSTVAELSEMAVGRHRGWLAKLWLTYDDPSVLSVRTYDILFRSDVDVVGCSKSRAISPTVILRVDLIVQHMLLEQSLLLMHLQLHCHVLLLHEILLRLGLGLGNLLGMGSLLGMLGMLVGQHPRVVEEVHRWCGDRVAHLNCRMRRRKTKPSSLLMLRRLRTIGPSLTGRST